MLRLAGWLPGRFVPVLLVAALMAVAAPASAAGGVLVGPPEGFAPAQPSDCPLQETGATETAVYVDRSAGEPGRCLLLLAFEPAVGSLATQLALVQITYRGVADSWHPLSDPPGAEVTETDDAGAGVTSLVFADGSRVFAYSVTGVGGRERADTRRDLLVELAHRQLALAPTSAPATSGPDPSGSGVPGDPGDPELAALIVDVPTVLGRPLLGPLALGFTPLEADAGLAKVVDILNRRTRRADRAWLDPGDDRLALDQRMSVGIQIERYPFPSFAAAALGLTDSIAGSSPTDLAPEQLPPGALARHLANANGPGDTTEIAFRNGAVSVLVLASGPGPDSASRDRVAVAVAAAQSAALGRGDTAPYRFPSPVAGTLSTVGAATAAGLAIPLTGRLLARARMPEGPRQAPMPGPAVLPAGPDARRLRRRGWILFAAQVLALDLAVIGFIGSLGWWGWPVGAAGLAAGLAVTWWARRAEGGATVRVASATAVVLTALSLAATVGGLMLAIGSLRDVAFGPGVTTMERSNTFRVSPLAFSTARGLLGLALVVAAAAVARGARARWRADAARLRLRDQRPPILYLRSFTDDRLPLPAGLSPRQPFSELLSFRSTAPFEEIVAWELSRHGPVTAVGQPGRGLANLGAAREHLSTTDWQTGVVERMAQAGLILLTIGTTEGLAYEVSQVVARGHLARTVFVFPPVGGVELGQRWSHVWYELRRAGADVGPLAADPSAVMYAMAGPAGAPCPAVVGDRRDEAAYQAGLRLLVTTEHRGLTIR